MTGRRLAACALAAVLAAGCAACTSGQSRLAARPSAAASSTPATPAPAAGIPTPALAAILPFSPARLQAAAVLADRFTASWDSWSWRQSPAAWLARLLPMTAAGLRPALAQAASPPGLLAQRHATRQAATATAGQIRDLTPGSVTVAVTVRQVITSTSGTTQATASFAVTLIPAGTGWDVWDIEPATAGNS